MAVTVKFALLVTSLNEFNSAETPFVSAPLAGAVPLSRGTFAALDGFGCGELSGDKYLAAKPSELATPLISFVERSHDFGDAGRTDFR